MLGECGGTSRQAGRPNSIKDADMQLRTSLLAGLTAACLWPATSRAADSPKLAQIKARISEARQASSGPLAGFAGIYDISDSCRPIERPDAGLGTLWLLGKSVIWFAGDDMLLVKFVTPDKVERATLRFRQTYAVPRERTIKLYDLTWTAGGHDIVGFLPDWELFGGHFRGAKFTVSYAMRCRNEDEITGATEAILRLMDL
jgi:hypothetical protein